VVKDQMFDVSVYNSEYDYSHPEWPPPAAGKLRGRITLPDERD
jgi:hypothetical protein